ncbi:MAG: Lrp/AsnC family transcriptional regulator [Candidatus Thermoplasmatota archaeon]|nr:Lrp/AsnC family transcriptional regulator [Candidatus Thermoplasmatota archaeon]
MAAIDLKDRKILYELDLDARQSLTQIGKKVGLKKDVVSYRIKRMQDEGIIKNFFTDIDTFRLGYHVFRIYINFQYVTSQMKEEIINYFVEYKNSWVVASAKSEFDMVVVIWVRDIFEFYQFWEKTLDKYEDYFAKYAISIYIKAHVYKKSYLLPNLQTGENREIYQINCGGQSVEIDETDHQLLNELAVNARAPLVELAEKLGCSSQTINYRIHNLVKSQVIRAFRVNVDLSKFELKHYKVDIYLKDHKLKKPVFEYLKDKPYLEYMNLAIGWADLEPEFVVNNFDELLKILEDINTKFSGAIKKQSFFITEKLYKLRCLPEL